MLNSGYITGVQNVVLRQLEMQARNALYFERPDLWAKDHLGVQMWSKQAEVALSVVRDKNVVVKAGHEVGKSWLAGVLICWWVDTRWHLPGGCFVVSTAPSTKQINAIVWREVRKFWQLSQERFKAGKIDHALPGYITSQAHWKLNSGIELGYGSKPPEGKEDSMSGIHARYVLAVGDEAVGLPEGLIDDLGNITSNATSRRFLICNPTNPLSYIAKIFKDDISSWSKHTISVYDSPNFHGGEGLPVEVLETLVDHTYIDDKIAEWGGGYWDEETKRKLSNKPKFVARVMGDFAWDAGPTLFDEEDMAKGLDCEVLITQDSRTVIGVDVSRSEGGDHNTIYSATPGVGGTKLRHVDSWNDKDAMRTAERIHSQAMRLGVSECRIDGSGLGGPIADRVNDLAKGAYLVIEMIGGKRSPDPNRWYNSRAYWYDEFARKMRNGEVDIDLEDKQLQEELLGMEYRFPKSGVQSLLIESKDDMKKRGVSSPDFADGANYAMADTSSLTNSTLPAPGARVGFDPFEMLQMQQEAWSPGVPG